MKPRYAAAAAAVLLWSCGYIGEPMYPLLNIPERVTDLRAFERGAAIAYQFTLPSLSTEGKQARIEKVEIRAGEAPLGEFNQDAWLAKSILLEAKPDDHGVVKSEIPAAPWVAKDLILGVKVYGPRSRAVGWSNLVTVTVVPPLPTPAAVTVTPVSLGVHVAWQGPAGQYRVFRMAGDERLALVATVEINQWLDSTIEYGKRYGYVIQAVRKAGVSEAVSEQSERKTVTPVDVFPPAAPTGLNAIIGAENIELVWDRNTEPDLAGYRLYRALDEGKLEKIADIQDVPSYSDRKIEAGKRYRYAVSAVDRLGNESKLSEAVAIAAP